MRACDDTGLNARDPRRLASPVFGGGNSTYEALFQDAVVVTLEGEFLRGRISAAMYRKMGLGDLIPADAKAYVEMALRVAQDRAFRAALQLAITTALPLLPLTLTMISLDQLLDQMLKLLF